MARTKEFDREEVLAKAMKTFWRYGYEGTSMQTLVQSMGINRGSLYDTFGDKRSLFLAAIAHYEQTVMQEMIACLTNPDAGKQTIIDLFRGLVAQIVADGDCYGCFITNTAIELCPHDAETQSRIDRDFRQAANAFHQALKLARSKGEISSNRDLASIAQYLTSSIQGLRVFAKVNRDPETINNIVDVILSVLE